MSTEKRPSSIGERIFFLRESKKLTQGEFAKPLGIKQGQISAIERGTREPSESVINLITQYYVVNKEWLLTGEGPMQQKEGSCCRGEERELDPVTARINAMLRDMSEDQKRDILRYIEKEKLLTDLLKAQRNEKNHSVG